MAGGTSSPTARNQLSILGMLGLLLVMLAQTLPVKAAPHEPTEPAQNPDLDAACGLDVLMILDESGSIANSNATVAASSPS